MAAKKKTTNAPAKPAYSLDEIEPQLPVGDPTVERKLRDLFFTAHSDAALVALGAGYRTEDILDAAPAFLAQVAEQVAPLGREELPIGLAKEHAKVLFAEAKKLVELNQQYEDAARRNVSEISKRRSQLKTAQSRALARRRVVARTLIKHVLPEGSPRRAELERAAAGADTPAGVAASVRTVAEIVEAVRRETPADLRTALDELGLRESLPQKMRDMAKELEAISGATPSNTPAPPVGQRELDRQDGVVLALMKHVHSSMRDASDDGAVSPPRIGGPLERLFVSVASDDDDEPTDPSTPAAPPS